MTAVASPRDVLARALALRLRLAHDMADMWAGDMMDDGYGTDEIHEAARAVARELPTGRQVMMGDLVAVMRATRAKHRSEENTARLLATGGRPDPEVGAQIARVAAAVAFSGRTKGRTEDEVRDEMRALWKQPQALAEAMATVDVDSEPARRARAAKAAAEPLRMTGAEMMERETQIQRDWRMSEEGHWVRR